MKYLVSILSFALLAILPFQNNAQTLKPEHMDQLKFRHVGPIGNRIVSVAGVPGDPLTYYVGAASGGVWKTIDGGIKWKPVFDNQKIHAIGALALSHAEPEIVYAGTGEPFIRSNVSIGDGLYKSTDGGETWSHLGLKETGRISRIVVHPDNPDVVYVAALGHAYTPQNERGIYKSIDGGKNWKHVLKVDNNTGASDLVMDPFNPRILFAGMWQLEMRPWTRTSGGPGSGIYKSTDGGETWTKLEGNGLPEGDVGKIALTMTEAQAEKIYALIETGDGIPLNGEPTNTGELWVSENRGNSWKLVNSNRDLSGRGAYYTRCKASPDNPNEIYFMAAAYSTSIDGGVTATAPTSFAESPNWDHHEMWIDPTDGNRQIVVGDGGLSISQNRGKSWYRVQLPVAQLYHVTTDNAVPYNLLTNRQDGPSMKGPSRSRMAGFFGAFIATGRWYDVGGGESGFAQADPTDPDIVWSSASGYGALGGVVTRFDEKSGQFRQVEVWPEITSGTPAADVKYRFQWTFPLLISPHDHNTIYVASQFVHRTKNGGQSWEIISPDLSLNDKSKQQFSGGLTGDNIGVEYANVVYALDESPVKAGLLWAGTNDGQVHVSQDNGANWTNLTKNVPEMPEYGAVRNIEASKYDEGTAYMTVDAHEMGDFKPYVYRTTNYGKSWKKITNGVEVNKISYCRMVKEDPNRNGLLYLGTEGALYFSNNNGDTWQSLMTNLPASPMYWMDIPEHFNDLVVGTYGRGIWILDDISPLQQYTSEVASSDIHLFNPKDAYQLHPVAATMQFFPEASTGDDPPPGTSLHYWLSESTAESLSEDSVAISITAANGDTVRTMKHKGKAGINRMWWNFMDDPTTTITMRTKPTYADWFPLDDNRTRKSLVPPMSVMVAPGTYTVHITHEDQTQSQSFEIMKDPNSEGTMDDIAAQKALLYKIKGDFEEISVTVNQAEKIRRQLKDLMDNVSKEDKDVIEKLKSVESTLTEIENRMVQLKHTGTGQDAIRLPGQLLEKLSYLGQTTGNADFRPADQYEEVYEKLNGEWKDVKDEWDSLIETQLQELMQMLNERNIGPLMVRGK